MKHLFYRFIWPKKFLIADCPKYGLKFRFFIRDGIGTDIYYKWGVYSEDYITKYLSDTINFTDNDLIIDIGANIGWYSLTISHKASPTVLSFEPDPMNYSLLTDNIALNHKDNIQPFNVAVSEHPGVMKLHLYKDYNMGRHSLLPSHKATRSVEVNTIRMDQFLEENGYGSRRIRFLKIDIEGYELTAMRGAKETLKRTDFILTEFSPGIMQDHGLDPMEYVTLLEDSGLQLSLIEEKGLSKPDYKTLLADKQGIHNLFGRRTN